MRKFLRLTVFFAIAVLTTHVVASALVTQHVLGRISDMGLEVSPAVRASSTAHDIVGMAPSYLPLIAIGFVIAFVVTALLSRLAPRARLALYSLAGATAIIAVNLAMSAAFDITPIASARTITGLLGQAFAGALGGLLFAVLGAHLSTRT